MLRVALLDVKRTNTGHLSALTVHSKGALACHKPIRGRHDREIIWQHALEARLQFPALLGTHFIFGFAVSKLCSLDFFPVSRDHPVDLELPASNTQWTAVLAWCRLASSPLLHARVCGGGGAVIYVGAPSCF